MKVSYAAAYDATNKHCSSERTPCRHCISVIRLPSLTILGITVTGREKRAHDPIISRR
jgi:hypothetical protein